ncbi:MAG: UDP-N-acetylglucosamine 1-carboxyvinyltransferase [Acidobacteriaceae bacterium]|nr:UDP-N-acetylglucosamine 1-carboxyvinyltransferase [Acidobacteriaceae bacterium]MBV9781200.1 UDP-N-acetylglucosamine 1-carboxyvinyltransferase [Acidobacteriaceae bacterium]
MDKFKIVGGTPLSGEAHVSGSKNSALPALAACLLTDEPVTLRRIPEVKDILTMKKLLSHTGARVCNKDGRVHVDARSLDRPEAPYEVVKTMRASSLVLGPLVARTGCARVSMPGGCAIGARPINLHVSALEELGATIEQTHGYVEARAPEGLLAANIHFDRITVTGTEDVLMAAVLARGETQIRNAAREPEVKDLADLLTKMGARIEGAGTSIIKVQGVERLHGAEHTIIPDRIEAGTFVLAGVISKGDLSVTGCVPDHIAALTFKLRQAGAEVDEIGADTMRVRFRKRLKATGVTTEEYPGFATDLQAQYMAAMTLAEGTCVVTETIFENRFMHAQELTRMGANIRIEGRQAIVTGENELTGAQVIASDLRGSASLILAALAARGESTIDRVYHMDRGYERMERKLAALGANIQRVRS